MSQERLIYLDILKAIAIIGVIWIHVISGAFNFIDPKSISFKFYLVLDQIFRFSVPLFVALSGYTLALKYEDFKVNLREFFTRRVIRILPWYLFWATFFLLYVKLTEPAYSSQYTLFEKYFLGRADYHLYFVPMIFQLYLLFPLLLFLLRRAKLGLLVGMFLFELGFYYFLTQVTEGSVTSDLFKTDQKQYVFFGTWVFYFLLGIYLRIKGNTLRALKYISAVFLVASFSWVLFDSFKIVSESGNLLAATRFTRIPVLFYASSFIAFCLFFSQYLLRLPQKIVDMLVVAGKRSYVIYLLHTFVIRLAFEHIPFSGNLKVLAVATFTIVVSNFLAQIAIFTALYLTRKVKLTG
ncbi:MAG: acyltransferase [Candidatus Curtissbacteria bacterium]|nr:acyltransferase [Candidatus Curtissbacteria bacterium]